MYILIKIEIKPLYYAKKEIITFIECNSVVITTTFSWIY